jgi:predicted membrane channel-forming protein YqfA (hemolysin III family)
MNSQTLLSLVIGVAVLGLLIFRNLRARPVRQANQRLYLILGVIGVVEMIQYLSKFHVPATTATAALAGSLVLAAVFGAIRAATVRVWMKDGQPWTQGNALTAVLWIIALGAHLGYDAVLGTHKDISGLGDATVLLYLVVSLAVQRMIVSARAAKLDPAGAGQPGWLP